MLKKIAPLLSVLALSAGLSQAAWAADAPATPSACEAKAIDKNGKALAGAAQKASVKKCEEDAAKACGDKALDKNGKPLTGAVKDGFVKKCVREGGPK